jgi:hypothetical protein
VDQQSIEDLFERNADMRLLEFRHNEPGKGAPPNKRQAGSSFSAESIVADQPDAAIEDAPRLRVTIAAAPKAGVIPGAVVGIAVDVFNDGTAPAPESKLLMSIPVETEYRIGTLRVDGREPQAPEQLFAAGLPIARLPGATSSKVTFQLGVLPGVNTLYLQPRLQTNGVPVVGTAGITIKRGASVPAAIEAPIPFYELDDEENEEEAARSAEPIMPPVLLERIPEEPPTVAPTATVAPPLVIPSAVEGPPPTFAFIPQPAPTPQPPAPVIAEPTPPPTAVIAEPTPPPAAVVAEPEPPVVAAIPPALRRLKEPATTQKAPLGTATAPVERMIRYRTLGNNDIALLDRLFTPDVPGIIAHYVVISSIACIEPGEGEDNSGYGAFLKRDIELLGRALVHSRMGKAPQYRIAQADLDGLNLTWHLTPQQAFPPQRRLRRDLRRPEWQAIGGLVAPSERDTTLRTRIALLALAGATLDGVDRRSTDDSEAALSAYRSSVLAWLVPLCVASAGAESFVIPNPPVSVDAAGRKLVAVLKSALTS